MMFLSWVGVGLPLVYWIGTWLYPAIVIRPQMNHGNGTLPEELKELLLKTAQDMDGGILHVNGSGVSGPQELLSSLSSMDDLKQLQQQYQQDGFVIVRNVIPKHHLPALEGIFTHIQEYPHYYQKFRERISCNGVANGSDKLIPEFAALIHRLNLHHVAAKLLQTTKLILWNTILHYNVGNCNKQGVLLSTHDDYYTAPFSVEKRQQQQSNDDDENNDNNGFWGDNGVIAWIAVDELSSETVTMQLGKGSHLRYTKAYPNATEYRQQDYCPIMWNDLAKEDNIIQNNNNHNNNNETETNEFLNSFVELPVLHPGDAVFFNGFMLHRPLPYCTKHDSGGCTRQNTRRITLRYIDGERTKYRSDIPSTASHPMARWCPTVLAQVLLGHKCRIQPGDSVDHLPIVINTNKDQGGRQIPGDGQPTTTSTSRRHDDPIWYYLGAGPRVHHDTCDLETTYRTKFWRRLLHRKVPWLQYRIWKSIPQPRPGEESIYQP